MDFLAFGRVWVLVEGNEERVMWGGDSGEVLEGLGQYLGVGERLGKHSVVISLILY